MFDVFNQINDYDIPTTSLNSNLIKSFTSFNKYDCARECSLNNKCVLILTKTNLCNLYSKVDYGGFISSQGSTFLLAKQVDDMTSINSNLVNYWPFNNNLNDIIGGANMFNGISYSFSNDRLNTPSSSIYLNNGYLQVPDGVYFNGDFTITLWLKIFTHRYCSRIIDFGGTIHSDNVCFGLSGKIYLSKQLTIYLIFLSVNKNYNKLIRVVAKYGTQYSTMEVI